MLPLLAYPPRELAAYGEKPLQAHQDIRWLPGGIRSLLLQMVPVESPAAQVLMERPINVSQEEQEKLHEQGRALGLDEFRQLVQTHPKTRVRLDPQHKIARLLSAINSNEVALVHRALVAEMQWVKSLYEHFAANSVVPRTEFEKIIMQRKFAERVFYHVDEAIAKEERRLACLSRWTLSTDRASSEEKKCVFVASCMVSLVSIVIPVLIAATHLPSFYFSPGDASSDVSCTALDAALSSDASSAWENWQDAFVKDCGETSKLMNVPCNYNASNLWESYNCCNDLAYGACNQEGLYYNEHIYPQLMLHTWMPTIIVGSSVAAIQIGFGVVAFYRRIRQRNIEAVKRAAQAQRQEFENACKHIEGLRAAEEV